MLEAAVAFGCSKFIAAVAQFRKVVFAQMLYGGGDVRDEKWNNRGYPDLRGTVREKIFRLAAEACLGL